MSNSFNFQQFSIIQQKNVMKVGTDGVLLGAWCNVEKVEKVLDIGTGTGLIALMIAQRNANCLVDAIEIDKEAADEAAQNVVNSLWNSRIEVQNRYNQQFAENSLQKYDLIACNPPFYTDYLKPLNNRRSTARHTVALRFEELFFCAKKLLCWTGSFSIIIPAEQLINIEIVAEKNQLFIVKKTEVYSTPFSKIRRLLISFSNIYKKNTVNKLIIEVSRHNYSTDYKQLTKEFYLNF
jgi:tRNA1Val (adenine37-N6)-methyltransferase